MRLTNCWVLAGAFLCSASLAAPIANPDNVVLAQCSETVVNVVANDRDPVNSLPLFLVSVSEVSLGTASIVGVDVIRLVSSDRSGTEILTYVVRDVAGDMSVGQLSITVSTENRCS